MATIDPFRLYMTILRKRNLYLYNNVLRSVKCNNISYGDSYIEILTVV
jgi:hypothetical protein